MAVGIARLGLGALLLLGLGQAIAPSAATETCRGEALADGTVRSVLDGRTLVLEDGRHIRLAGVHVALDHTGGDRAAQAYLQSYLAGRPLRLFGASVAADRHGRSQVYAYAGEGLEGLVQRAMVIHGLARAGDRVGDRACVASLLNGEGQARTAGRGLWADPANAVRQADEVANILGLRGKFALVEGRVQSVRESGGTTYVNFGRRWSEDFTATIAKRNERNLIAGGLVPKTLERRVVRIRGWVEERGGPWIEVFRPDQVELVRN